MEPRSLLQGFGLSRRTVNSSQCGEPSPAAPPSLVADTSCDSDRYPEHPRPACASSRSPDGTTQVSASSKECIKTL